MTSAFIIEVNSQLQPDPNEETAALLRVLIHKVDNTTFGDDVPSIPQWTGPPHTIVQVQAILFASLAASLFSAFLGMLGKQWLNRYASVDMRGSAIERSQNRQRKLDGVVSWYFDHVLESQPLMLQVALLLLGVALSRYLLEIDTTVASVVLGFTSSGVLFFLFIVVAGAISVSCPYQTPGARILRRIPDTLHHIPNVIRRIPHIPGTLHLVFSAFIKGSISCGTLREVRDELKEATYPLIKTAIAFLFLLRLPICLIIDGYKAITWLLVAFSRRLQRAPEQQQMALLDLHCVLWTLQISLDGPVRLTILNYLATMTLVDFDPALVVECFDILFGCVKTIDRKPVIAQGMEQLAAASSACCLQALSHLMAIDPTSRVIEDTRKRYTKAFPLSTDITGLPFFHTFRTIHTVSHLDVPSWFWRETQEQVRWEGYNPSASEHVIVARALIKIAWFEYRRGYERVPRWILSFALHSLSQSPLPPASVVVDSLSIVAISLGCGTLSVATLGERCVRV